MNGGIAGGPPTRLGLGEFIALMAMLTALVALSIDMILPGLPAIGSTLGVVRANDNQLVISVLFLGFGLGQLFYGPLSDATGRKPMVYAGLGLYISGCLFALLATTYPVMLTGRFLQGLGVAGPRTMTLALVRDRFEGRAMARIMSLVMTVFILVPVVAPTLGQVVLRVSGWRTIFGIYLALGVVASAWFGLRQEETLPAAQRIPFTPARLTTAFHEVLTSRAALGYTAAAGLVYGAFLGYLSSAQQILQQQYALGARFPVAFATLALALGASSYLNARLVVRHGMRRLSTWSLRTFCAIAIGFLGIAVAQAGRPPLWALMAYLMPSFFCIGLLFSNLTAMAMQPLGRVAGTGAAVVGGLATLTSLGLGTAIGQSYDGTILPLTGGFAGLSVLALIVASRAEPGTCASASAP